MILFLSSSESSWLLRIDSKLLWQLAVDSGVTSTVQNHGVPNSNIVNNNPILKLQNGMGTECSCLKCGHNLISRKIIHCLYGDLARTTKNESKIQESLKLRTPTQGFYCTCVFSCPGSSKHSSKDFSIIILCFLHLYIWPIIYFFT